jgi:hypothetical protein
MPSMPPPLSSLRRGLLLALLPLGVAVAGPGRDLARAVELPIRAHELRAAGVPAPEVAAVVQAAEAGGLDAAEATDVLVATGESVEESGQIDNLGAFVKEQVASGKRGRELSAAIHEEHARRGEGGKGKGPPEHAKDGEGGPPPHAKDGQGGPPDHAKGKPPAHAQDGQGGPPPHAQDGEGGPPDHAQGGGGSKGKGKSEGKSDGKSGGDGSKGKGKSEGKSGGKSGGGSGGGGSKGKGKGGH